MQTHTWLSDRSRVFQAGAVVAGGLLASSLLACGSDAPATTIQLAAVKAPALVAFRDGPDASWQAATMKTPTSFELQVHGPYVAMVVCDFGGLWSTVQIGRTLDDSHDLGTFCPTSPGGHRVTGQMVQAGTMVFGRHLEISTDPAWEFQFFVPDGSYDLLAITADRMAVQRKVAISADAVLPAVDVAATGTALAGVAFSAANAVTGEDLRASVLVGTADSAQAELYFGPSASAKVAPEALLTATDSQTVSLQAMSGTSGRALRRPFRVGGDTAYTLPAPLTGIQWAAGTGKLAVSWMTRPPQDDAIAFATGTSPNGTDSATASVDLSVAFLAATGIATANLVNDAPGYKPEWNIDLANQYTREIDFQSVTDGLIATNWDTETVNPSPGTGNATLRAAARATAPLR